jgi:hypothetical protein
MDGLRFDAWTRRRFGLVVGGMAASVAGLAARDAADARKRKKRKKRCKKLKQICQPGSKTKKCCTNQDLVCGVIVSQEGNHCCRPAQGRCATAGECCDGRICMNVIRLDGPRCCGISNESCAVDQDCCASFNCNEQTGECE